jgi:hypothetical protein
VKHLDAGPVEVYLPPFCRGDEKMRLELLYATLALSLRISGFGQSYTSRRSRAADGIFQALRPVYLTFWALLLTA